MSNDKKDPKKLPKELVYKFQHAEKDSSGSVVRKIELVVMKPKGYNSDPARGYEAYINTLDANGEQTGPGVKGRYVPGKGRGPGVFSEAEYSKIYSDGKSKTIEDYFPIAQLFLQTHKKDMTPIAKPFMSMNLITKEESRPFKEMLDALRTEANFQNESMGLTGNDRVSIADMDGYDEYISLRGEIFGKVTRERRALGMTVIVGHEALGIPKPEPRAKNDNSASRPDQKSALKPEPNNAPPGNSAPKPVEKQPSIAPQADQYISSAEFGSFVNFTMKKCDESNAESTYVDLISQYVDKLKGENTHEAVIRKSVIKEVTSFLQENKIGTSESNFPSIEKDFLKQTINVCAPPKPEALSPTGTMNA